MGWPGKQLPPRQGDPWRPTVETHTQQQKREGVATTASPNAEKESASRPRVVSERCFSYPRPMRCSSFASPSFDPPTLCAVNLELHTIGGDSSCSVSTCHPKAQLTCASTTPLASIACLRNVCQGPAQPQVVWPRMWRHILGHSGSWQKDALCTGGACGPRSIAASVVFTNSRHVSTKAWPSTSLSSAATNVQAKKGSRSKRAEIKKEKGNRGSTQ